MKTIQTMALVLKTCNMNDNDKLVTLFSPDHGRLTAVGKGVRSHKHKDFAALQPFCFANVTLNCKQGGLFTVTATEVADSFFDLRSDVLKVSFAAYYMDVVADIAQDIIGDEDYFSFVLNTLYLTGKAGKGDPNTDITAELKKLKMIFEFRTACVMGVMPEVERCIVCGKDKDLTYFSCEDGGAVCTDCAGRYNGRDKLPISVTPTDLKVIEYIVKSDSRSVFKFQITDDLLATLGNIGERYLISQTETYYKSLEYLHKILSDIG